MQQLLEFLFRLRDENIQFNLECQREAIMVVIAAPGKYYEIEFFADSHVEVQTWGPVSEVEVVPYQEMRDRVIAEIL